MMEREEKKKSFWLIGRFCCYYIPCFCLWSLFVDNAIWMEHQVTSKIMHRDVYIGIEILSINSFNLRSLSPVFPIGSLRCSAIDSDNRVQWRLCSGYSHLCQSSISVLQSLSLLITRFTISYLASNVPIDPEQKPRRAATAPPRFRYPYRLTAKDAPSLKQTPTILPPN